MYIRQRLEHGSSPAQSRCVRFGVHLPLKHSPINPHCCCRYLATSRDRPGCQREIMEQIPLICFPPSTPFRDAFIQRVRRNRTTIVANGMDMTIVLQDSSQKTMVLDQPERTAGLNGTADGYS